MYREVKQHVTEVRTEFRFSDSLSSALITRFYSPPQKKFLDQQLDLKFPGVRKQSWILYPASRFTTALSVLKSSLASETCLKIHRSKQIAAKLVYNSARLTCVDRDQRIVLNIFNEDCLT